MTCLKLWGHPIVVLKYASISRQTSRNCQSQNMPRTIASRVLFLACSSVVAFLAYLLVPVRQRLEFLIRQVLDIDHFIVRFVD